MVTCGSDGSHFIQVIAVSNRRRAAPAHANVPPGVGVDNRLPGRGSAISSERHGENRSLSTRRPDRTVDQTDPIVSMALTETMSTVACTAPFTEPVSRNHAPGTESSSPNRT